MDICIFQRLRVKRQVQILWEASSGSPKEVFLSCFDSFSPLDAKRSTIKAFPECAFSFKILEKNAGKLAVLVCCTASN